MQLDSARNLKSDVASLFTAGVIPAGGAEGYYDLRAGGVRAFDLRAHRRADVQRNQPLVAIGITPSAGKRSDFRLAVRVQRRALEDSPALDEVTRMARGEVDLRYIGSVVKRETASPARARTRTAPAPPWYRRRNRPLLIGSSVGHVDVTAGTLGCFVRATSGRGGVQFLSNNHVLADENQGELGDTIVQPGVHDGGRVRRDRVGRLRRFAALKIRRPNLVDCAVCELDEGIEYEAVTLRGGKDLEGLATDDELALAQTVGKLGRTTGYTEGRITAFELDGVTVRYDVGLLTFDNQVEIEGAGERAFSDGGDSGSMVFTDDGRRAGALLFAGSDQGGTNGKGLTYANPLGTVMEKLKIELVTE